MVDPAINVAIFIIWWWMAFFAMLPLGVKQVDPSEAVKGHDAGAPVQPMIWKKALWAAGIGAVLWAVTASMIWFDPFHIRT